MKNSELDHTRSRTAGAIAAPRAERLANSYRGAAGEALVFAELGIEVHAGGQMALAGESGMGKSMPAAIRP